MKTESITRRLIICAIYAIAMAYVESAVVVYLREYLNGSTRLFPLVPFPPLLYRTEIGREAATFVMIGAVAALQSRKPRIFLAFFIYCLGIWDIFYYVWLEVLIGWPAGLLSWDVLFLIPRAWFGPVLSPVIASVLLIGGAVVMLRFEAAGKPLPAIPLDWLLTIASGLAILVSYLWEVPRIGPTGPPPTYYPWWLFAVGGALWIVTLTRRIIHANRMAARRVTTAVE